MDRIHSYAAVDTKTRGPRSKTTQRTSRSDERVASFHTYAAPSLKRSRELSSPTGKTPVQVLKRRDSNNVDVLSKRTQWSAEEKEFLENYVHEAGGVPKEGANSFWNQCSEALSRHCRTSRTGEMCRSRYKKVKSLFGDITETKTRSVATQTEIAFPGTSTQTQTQPALPIVKDRKSTSFWADLSDTCFSSGLEKSSPMYKLIRSRFTVEDLSINDRSELLNCCLNKDTSAVADCIVHIPPLKLAIENQLLSEIENSAASKCVRSTSSYLFSKDYHSLRDFSFEKLIAEFMEKQPLLLKCLLAVAVPTIKLSSTTHDIEDLIPKLAFTYSSLMSTRFHELSRLQKTLSVVLMDEHVHEKVFDRLQVLGVTTSYKAALSVMEDIGNYNYNEIIKGAKEDKSFRIIGDNCNLKVGVKHERGQHHGTMYNWFASSIILQTKSFQELPDIPQGQPQYLPLTSFVPTEEDERRLKCDYRFLIAQVAKDFLPKLNFLFDALPSHIYGEHSQELSKRNLVVPLEVLPLNEQKYADVIQIMEHYEDCINKIYGAAEKPVQQIQVGGDQLTRERFTGAKGLRTGCVTDRDCFNHLYPISFELWHTAMNFLVLIYNKLFDEQSFEKGTMNAARIKLSRKTVKKDVQHHYDHDKDFFLSFLRSYIVEALCQYFGMESLDAEPTRNIPTGVAAEHLETWVQQILDKFIDEYVWARGSDATITTVQECEDVVTTPLQLTLPNGTVVVVHVQQKKTKQVQQAEYDRIKHYAHTVLELGLLYMEFLDIIKVPDRNRLLSTMKYMMHVFKTNNSRSKYALEILRFLCHQQSSYSLKTAHKAVYGLFVNTGGKIDSHIPADLQMEHIIRKVKKLFKATGPNNLEGAVVKKSRALAAMSQIAEQYDASSGVIVRANKHKKKSAHEDEMKIIKDLKEATPFFSQPGRTFDKFANIVAPFHSSLKQEDYTAWINYHKKKLQYESGK